LSAAEIKVLSRKQSSPYKDVYGSGGKIPHNFNAGESALKFRVSAPLLRETTPRIHWIGSRIDPTADLDAVEIRKLSSLYRE
jgi:hypothetical protein